MFVSTRYIGLYPFSGTVLPEDSRSPFCVRRPSWIERDAVRPINVQPTGLLARELAAGKGYIIEGMPCRLISGYRLGPLPRLGEWHLSLGRVAPLGCNARYPLR
jgi:hypothetical protein